MAVMIDNEDMPEVLRGLRKHVVEAENDAAKQKGSSTYPNAMQTLREARERLEKYKRAFEMAKN